jgi:hypothetical protein
MLAPTTSFRPLDWTSAQQAAYSYADQIRAYSRLPAQKILSAPWWLLIDQSGAERPWRQEPGGLVTHGHFVDLVELDSHGTTAIINREIGNIADASYVIICPWDTVPAAAAYLRVHYLGRGLQPCSALATHVSEACFHLEITERSANDTRLPNCSRIRAGILFRLDSSGAEIFQRYFSLPIPVDSTEPTVVELGAGCCLVYASLDDPREPLRAILTTQLFLSPALKEIGRWIRSHSLKRKESNK